jgi:hypothetical protein
VKRFSRWLKNDGIEGEVYFMPFAEALVAGLAHQALVLVIDGSDVGRGCITLMVSVLYKKRALPLAWLVIEGSKGHFPETAHITLLEQVRTLIPPDASVIFLGDGEFDGIELQAALAGYGWSYVCRTARNIQLCEEGEWFTFEDLAISPGRCVGIPEVLFTAQAYGPVLAIAQWGPDTSIPSTWSPTWSWSKRLVSGIANAFISRLSFLTRRRAASTCTKATCLTRNVSPV